MLSDLFGHIGFDVADAEALRYYIIGHMAQSKRAAHILSVEQCALGIACALQLSDADNFGGADMPLLRQAALLHDVTKEFTVPEHIRTAFTFGVELTSEQIAGEKVLHSITGSLAAAYLFHADSRVSDAILNHTTGAAGMALMDKIIFLADYIEPRRRYADCVTLREIYESGRERLYAVNNYAGAPALLDSLMLTGLDMTVRGLLDDGKFINTRTVGAYNYFVKNTGIL